MTNAALLPALVPGEWVAHEGHYDSQDESIPAEPAREKIEGVEAGSGEEQQVGAPDASDPSPETLEVIPEPQTIETLGAPDSASPAAHFLQPIIDNALGEAILVLILIGPSLLFWARTAFNRTT